MHTTVTKKLTDYVLRREDKPEAGGPVITLSRNFGCPSQGIAERLVPILAEQTGKAWRAVNRKILETAAKNLGIPAEDAQNIARSEKSVFQAMIESFSNHGHLPDENEVRDTLASTIRKIAEQGNVIIIGRAGNVILRNMPQAIHVRLEAPLEWRVARLSDTRKITRAAALAEIESNADTRPLLHDYFAKNYNNDKNFFDLVINCGGVSEEQAVAVIKNLLAVKGLLG